MMEFDDIVVKENPGLCRCCLSEGCYKDLGTEYSWMNETEVYADMLLECFDISITQHNEGPNGPNRLICEVCITRLRDACNFKKQVMDSEKKFIDMMGRGEFRPKMLIYQTQMKCEDTSVDVPVEDADVEYLEDEIEFGDDGLVKDELVEASVSDITVSTLPVKGKRGRPRKQTLGEKPEKRMKTAKEDKAKSAKTVSKENTTRVSVKAARDEIRRLVSILIENSTVMPFKWFLNRFRCFYCDHTFVDALKLKQHTKQHEDIKIQKVLKQIGTFSRIKWDVSEISCKLCPKTVKNFDQYLSHITYAHDIEFDRDFFDKHCYLFSLSDDGMKCFDCHECFQFFNPYLRHVNKYHNKSKQYICDECGLAFALKGTIKHHIKNIHSSQTVCSICGEKFKTKLALSNHCRKSHKTGKFKCSICPQTFESRYVIKNHIALVHNVKSLQFPCEKCPKIFTRKSSLVKHVSCVHLKEKFVTCHLCGYKGYDIQALKRHLATHDASKEFICELCNKKCKTSKSLAVHTAKHNKMKNRLFFPWVKCSE